MSRVQSTYSNNSAADQFSTPHVMAAEGPPLDVEGDLDEDDGTASTFEQSATFFVRALYDFQATDASSLSFRKGALIEVLTQLESGWWDGLMSNDVRGWFPSNYVTRISDEEAEAELQAESEFANLSQAGQKQVVAAAAAAAARGFNGSSNVSSHGAESTLLDSHPSATTIDSQYAGLGLGQDFDALRKLMGDMGSHAVDGTDPFEQMANASLTDTSSRDGKVATSQVQGNGEHRLGVFDARRRSRMSDQSSHIASSMTTNSTAHSNFSQTDVSSMPTRSTAASLSDADGSRKAALLAADAANMTMPSIDRADSPEKERLRAHTVSVPDGQQNSNNTLSGRPRAQTTHAVVPSTSSSASSGSAANGSVRHAQSKAKPVRDADSFWVPKASERGEIFYLNTRTGQTARDLPNGAHYNEGVGNDDEDDEVHEERLGSDEEERMQDRTVQTTNQHTIRRDLPTTDSRPSTAGSSLHATANKTSRSNAIENMPDPRDIPWPWIVRTSDDERSFHLYNRQTHEISVDVDSVLSSSSSSSFRHQSRKVSDASIQPSPRTRNGRSLSAVKRDEAAKAAMAPKASVRYDDEQDAYALQQGMADAPHKQSLRQMIDEAGDAIATLASLASESIGADGLSEEDAKAVVLNRNSLQDTSRLSVAIADVVRAVRDVLHASGTLSVASVDMASAALGLEQFFCGMSVSMEALTVGAAFQSSIIELQSPNVEQEKTDPYVIAAQSLAAAAAPQTLVSLGKKINATLSKLVLSARSVVEQSCLNAEIRPNLSEAQVAKILTYRQRIKDDSMELARALGAFGNEAARSRVASETGLPGWMRRNVGQLQSASGMAGIGPVAFGGGAAAGWRGQGFVLPTATEAAALRAEAQGAYQNPFELTREARDAIASGKVTLRRKPTLPLSRSFFDATIVPKFVQLDRALDEITTMMDTQSQISPSTAQRSTNAICGHFGVICTLIEEADLASTIDVDGPNTDDFEVQEYLTLVSRARELLQTLVKVKQAAYDGVALLLLQMQESLDEHAIRSNGGRDPLPLDGRTSALLEGLDIIAKQLQGTLLDLIEVIELQRKSDVVGSMIGARSKVYGIDDVKLKFLADDRGQEDVLYLGPGLAVPDAPGSVATSQQNAATTPTASSAVENKTSSSTASPSSLKTMFQRGRSSIAPDAALPVDSRAVGTKMRRDTLDGAASAPVSLHDGASVEGGDAASSTSVPLKQVEETPWYLQADTPSNDIVLNANGQVKGATLPALMERLTMHNALDSSFNTTFLMTYRSFTTTDELLDLLFARFRIEEPHGLTEEEHDTWVEKKQRPIRFRVFNVLKSWLETQYHEGENEVQIQRIKDFAMDEMVHSPAMNTPANLLLRIIERRKGTGEQVKITMVMPGSAPPPILPKNFRKIKFLDIDPLEMARQLTLMDSRLYNRIRPAECLGQAWNKPNAAEFARGIRDVISANNRVSGWVSEAILVQEDVKKRAAWVKQFVAIADRCYALNNFSSMMAISSGLNNASLSRLRRTWDAVNQRHLQLFENIRTIWAPTRNFSKYRETLRKLNPPCVPFLGVYLTDLTFIEEGNHDRMRTDDRLINFGKRQMTAEKIQEIMIYQSTPYNLTPVPGIQKFIEENLIEARSEDELFEQSLRLEPREREDEKIARLLQESGFL